MFNYWYTIKWNNIEKQVNLAFKKNFKHHLILSEFHQISTLEASGTFLNLYFAHLYNK